MRFVGFNRLAFYAAGDRMLSFYNDGLLNNSWRWDVFEDVLPLAEAAGIDVVPVLPSLANYSELFTFTDPDSFQIGASGDVVTDARRNRCPDPLRPEVKEQLLWFLSELVERAQASRSVTAIGMTVDGASGTCYATPQGAETAAEAGYSRYDLESFQSASGVTIEGGTGNPSAAYAWMMANPQVWQAWLGFRCARTRDVWLACRDLVAGEKQERYLFIAHTAPGSLAQPTARLPRLFGGAVCLGERSPHRPADRPRLHGREHHGSIPGGEHLRHGGWDRGADRLHATGRGPGDDAAAARGAAGG